MTTEAKTLTLKTAIGSYGHTAALKDGSVTAKGVQLDHIEVTPITSAFRRMCRAVEFDICEMAITTYLAAKAHNLPFTALPVFPVRAFHHGGVIYNQKSGIKTPKDLEGRRVGVRAYTVTTGVWVRGVLATEYGVDLDKVTWVIVDEEHVAEFMVPSNVVMEQKPLMDMLVAGEIDAAIGIGASDSPDIMPLNPGARQAEEEWYKRTNIFPINHTVVVKNELLAAEPWLAAELYAAFKEAKDGFVARISAEADPSAEAKTVLARRALVGPDPLPYGVAANKPAIDAIIQMATAQHILPPQFSAEEVFVPSTVMLA